MTTEEAKPVNKTCMVCYYSLGYRDYMRSICTCSNPKSLQSNRVLASRDYCSEFREEIRRYT